MDDYIGKSFKKAMMSHMEAAPAKTKPIDQNMIVHKGSLCDNCGTSPIIGGRFMCLICKDIDLCEQCEYQSQLRDSNIHPKSHPMIKLKMP